MPIRGLGRPGAYKLFDGERVSSVTTISSMRQYKPKPLQRWYYKNGYEDGRLGLPMNPDAKLHAAAGAGTLAHMMVENQIHGEDPLAGIDTSTVVPATLASAQTGFQGYLSWQKMMDVEYLCTEEPMVSEKYRYGGTPDAIGKLRDDRICLLDWKSSGAVYGDHIIQLAAYRQLWNEHHGDLLIQAVYLLRFGREHGEFSFHSWPDSLMDQAWQGFLHLRAMYDLDKMLEKAAK